ncbi:MAG: DNA-3-methyladenine glycosylase [Nitrospirae bacterium]|nr:MAG: DNA-3-methyladenine glycosylase [Nitrospirota bacterium]
MKRQPLARSFYEKPTLTVARSLLGKYLVRETAGGRLSGRIVEVEAYVGPEDRASHASRGKTKRTEVMFGKAGITYVYLIYGMYHCFNIVTEQEGYPAAILVRAVELESGELIDGPGRLCRQLDISRTHNWHDLTSGEQLWVEDRGQRIAPRAMLRAPRIGVDYAGEWAAKPWRFRLKGL